MKKILIIDDDPIIIRLLTHRIETEGHQALFATDGDKGLEKTKEEKPDVIVLDVLMPNVDGYSFVEELKKDQEIKSIPIIILTGQEGLEEIFKKQGIKEYFVKPFDIDELFERIEKFL